MPSISARYTVVPFEAEFAEGGGMKYMVVDAEKGGLGGGGVVYHNGGHLFTRDQATADGWAATLNQAVRLNHTTEIESVDLGVLAAQ